MDRIVLHVDVNNAFLSWTACYMLRQGSRIDIRDRYAVIGGDESKRKGIVLAKSNLCKSRGVITGEPIYYAKRKCPYLEVYSPNIKIYKYYSDMMYNYLKSYSDDIERYSIDECFIEISGFRDPVKLAYTIKEDIKKKFGFTVNVGVGNNKLLAKMASDFEKPDKVHTLFYDEIEKKMWPLDIENLFMIGKSYSKKLRNLNINTIYDLAHSDENMLKIYFKNMGIKMFEYANGIDNSKVESDYGLPKSISTSEVLPYDYGDREKIYKVIKDLSMQTGKKLREKNMYTSLVHIGIKYNDFSKVSKQISLNNYISSDIDIYNYAITLFDKLWVDEDKKVRGVAVGVANLSETYIEQLDLFNVNDNKKNNVKVQKTIDEIRKKYGDNSIVYADDIKN